MPSNTSEIQPSLQLQLSDAAMTDALGHCLARSLPDLSTTGALVALQGDLGAGKTALVRAMLRELGVTGTIRSPTYTLLEPYEIDAIAAMHMDLYRLADPEELEFLGVREFDAAQQLLLVEWPDKGAGFLPKCDLKVKIEHPQVQYFPTEVPNSNQGRIAWLSSHSTLGDQWIAALCVELKANNNLKKST